jgi:hypothetical protein
VKAAALALLVGLGAACAPSSSPGRSPSVAAARALSVEDLLAHPADVKVTLHPREVADDRVYGALLRKASALAAAYAGPPSLGTTALAVLERADAIDAAMNDAGEAVCVLRGVPADLDVARVVDEAGRPVWRPVVGDVMRTFDEYEPEPPSDGTLFVLPGRVWVVASGDARMHARERFVQGATPALPLAEGEAGLAVMTIRGSALVQKDPRLRSGVIAPLGRSLARATFELTPGALGVLVTRLDYTDAPAASGAEQTARDIVAAFRRLLEGREQGGRPQGELPPLSWLAAAGVERKEREVTVRAPIPRRWLDAIALADVPAAAPPAGPANGAQRPMPATPEAPAASVPWSLWRRSAPAPLLLPEPGAGTDLPQEPSQTARSPLTLPAR